MQVCSCAHLVLYTSRRPCDVLHFTSLVVLAIYMYLCKASCSAGSAYIPGMRASRVSSDSAYHNSLAILLGVLLLPGNIEFRTSLRSVKVGDECALLQDTYRH